MKFSKIEIKELIKAWFFVSLAFSILFFGGYKFIFSFSSFIIFFVVSAFTVGISFLLHELMHKFLAQKYGYKAEFRAFDKMLFLGLLMSFFGFIFVVPGGVLIKGLISKEKNGRISLAGPLSNLVLSIFFLLLLFSNSSEILNLFFNFGFRINSFLAALNMLPFPGADGKKVYEWNKKVFLVILILAVSIFIYSFFVR